MRMEWIALAERGEFPRVTEMLLPLLIHPSRLSERALTDDVRSMARNIGADAFERQQHAIMSRADSLACSPRSPARRWCYAAGRTS